MKRVLSVLLTLALMVTVLPMGLFTFTTTATAVDASGTIGDCSWVLEGTVLTISGDGSINDGFGNTLPDWKYNVTHIDIEEGIVNIGADAFCYWYSLKSVKIPESVRTIGVSAFFNCGLTAVTIPNGVTDIKQWAFDACVNLVEVNIGNSVESIGYGAFQRCTSLIDVQVGDNVIYLGEYAFYKTALYNDEKYWENGVLYIDNYLVESKKSVSGDLEIKEGTLAIVDSAFDNRDSLVSVRIPDSVKSIGYGAFRSCDSLERVSIGKGLAHMGDDAFLGCKKLKSVSVGGYVIGYRAFYNCPSLSSLIIKQGIKSIDDYAFSSCSSLVSVNIPDSVLSIGREAFGYCDQLASIVIPDSVKEIGTDAFVNTAYYKDSTNWTNDILYIGNHLIDAQSSLSGYLKIDNSTVSICGGAFMYCSNLENIVIPYGITNIGGDTFYRCTSLAYVAIPHTVKSIGDYAFSETPALKTIYFGGDIVEWNLIETGVKNDTLLNAKVIFPIDMLGYTILNDEIVISGSKHHNTTIYGEIRIPQTIQGYPVVGIDFAAFADCDRIYSVIVPNGVKSIGGKAFENCVWLEKIEIADSVNSIGELILRKTPYYDNEENWDDGVLYVGNHLIESRVSGDYNIRKGTITVADCAFADSEISSITIPQSVINIGSYAFKRCKLIKSIVLSDNVKRIGVGAFAQCRLLSYVKLPNGITEIEKEMFYLCQSLTDIEIPSSVTSVNDYAFHSCFALSSIIIPDNVKTIGVEAFANTGLVSIVIPSSVDVVRNYAFAYNTKLNSAYIYATYLAEDAFYYSGLKTVHIDSKYVEPNVFDLNELLEKVTVGKNVERIRAGAFDRCESIKDVYFTFSEEHLDTISIYSARNTSFYNADWHFNWSGVVGDFDGDSGLSAEDAIFLLYNSLYGDEEYPVGQNCDFNGDGKVAESDAVYLLYSVIFGEEFYPLKKD